MPYRYIIYLFIIIVLSACQSDHQTSSDQTLPQENTALQINESTVKPTLPSIDLEVTQQSLEQLYDNEDQDLTANAPVRITKQESDGQKTKISGGVLLDEERSMITDGVEGIDGAEVKISVPLH